VRSKVERSSPEKTRRLNRVAMAVQRHKKSVVNVVFFSNFIICCSVFGL
jgi:hypothetical protein